MLLTVPLSAKPSQKFLLSVGGAKIVLPGAFLKPRPRPWNISRVGWCYSQCFLVRTFLNACLSPGSAKIVPHSACFSVLLSSKGTKIVLQSALKKCWFTNKNVLQNVFCVALNLFSGRVITHRSLQFLTQAFFGQYNINTQHSGFDLDVHLHELTTTVIFTAPQST